MQTARGPAQQSAHAQSPFRQNLVSRGLRNLFPRQPQAEPRKTSWRQQQALANSRKRQKLQVAAATSGSDKEAQRPKDVKSIRRLPIFPLQVAMPYVPTGLNIFEARYRVLFNTLLSGADGLEEGLVNHQSPFCGSRTFGMCLITRQGMTAVGTTLHIDNHLLRPDGQMSVTSSGQERFRIQNIVEQTPVLICDVEMLQGDDTQSLIAQDIANEVRRLFKELIALNSKISAKRVVAGDLTAPELDQSSPEQLSFVIASMFSMNPILQQSLLEEEATLDRLRKERDLLQNTLNYQSATSALKSAFTSPAAEKSEEGQSSPESLAESGAAAPKGSETQPDPAADKPAAEGLPEQEDRPPSQSGPD